MNLDLTPKQVMIRKMITELVDEKVKPYSSDTDKNQTFPREQINELAKRGIMGMSIPKRYGGAELSNVSQTIIMEEVSRGCASTSVTMGAHTSLCCYPLVNHATEDQKERFLPKLASGEHLGAFALTEPSAGSDAVNVQTTAVRDKDEYIINGNKIFITNGGEADLVNFVATTDKAAKHKGLAIFSVEAKKARGFILGKKEDKLGLRGSNTQELVFQDMRLPKENLIGEKEGIGFKIAMEVFNSGRVGIGIQGVGIAQAALDECLRYVNEREQFGRKLFKFQAISFMLAEMATKIEAARLLCYKASHLKDMKRRYAKDAAMAKLYGSDVSMDVTRKAIQIFGGYGYVKDYPLERFYRDAKVTEIYEGTSEIQKLIIGNELLGRGF